MTENSHRSKSLSAVSQTPSYGIGVTDDENDYFRRLEKLDVNQNPKDRINPNKIADKVTELINMTQELSITARDNNAILCQMLFAVEERLNRRIDQVREEMVELINNKFASGQAMRGAQPNAILPPKPHANARRSIAIVDANGDMVEFQQDKVVYENVAITPFPGFVIKTKKLLGNKDKVFINVFHHDYIALDVKPNLPRAELVDQRPWVIIDRITYCLDKDNQNCACYNVAVSTEYFKQPNNIEPKITSPVFIQRIIHKVNIKFNEFLDESSYVLPRSNTGYKGDDIPSVIVPVPVKSTSPPPPPPTTSTSTASSAAALLFNNMNNNTTPSPRNTTSAATATLLASSANQSHNNSFSFAQPPITPIAANNTSNNSSNQDMVRRSSGLSNNGDDSSVVSELTIDNLESNNNNGRERRQSTTNDSVASANKSRRATRKSVFDTSQFGMNSGNIAGRNLLSEDMLEFKRELSASNAAAENLKQASATEPGVLLGWQITIGNDFYVITGVRKNYLSKTEYRISRFGVDDQWVRLKRGDKSGNEFRPMRKVLMGLEDDEDAASVVPSVHGGDA